MAVDLLLEHAQPVADADQLLEEHPDRHVLGLALAGRHQLQRAAHPALAELEVDVEPAVVAEHGAHGLRDAVQLGIAGAVGGLQAVERERDGPGFAAREHDHVPVVVVGHHAAAAEVAMLDDRAEPEAWPLAHAPMPSSSTSKISVAPGGMTPAAPRSP